MLDFDNCKDFIFYEDVSLFCNKSLGFRSHLEHSCIGKQLTISSVNGIQTHSLEVCSALLKPLHHWNVVALSRNCTYFTTGTYWTVQRFNWKRAIYAQPVHYQHQVIFWLESQFCIVFWVMGRSQINQMKITWQILGQEWVARKQLEWFISHVRLGHNEYGMYELLWSDMRHQWWIANGLDG